MVNPRTDYSEDAVEAARHVMLELSHVLGEYQDCLVIVGGWVPALILAAAGAKHIGSNDVDIAVDHRKVTEEGYRTIREHLTSRGYVQGSQPYVFLRTVKVNRRDIVVHVDFLSGEYGGTGKSHRHQLVQEDLHPRKARGCDLAFDNNVEIRIEGTLPGGGKDSGTIRVAGIVPFIAMKGMALASRAKEKDAWDIYFCLRYFPGGLEALAEMFKPHLQNALVQEGLDKINAKFASPEHVGPKWVVDFDQVTDPEAREIRQREAYERVSKLLELLGIK